MHIATEILVATLVYALVTAGCIWTYFRDKKTWNNGICTKYGEPWLLFDRWSCGVRDYMCRDEHILIHWPVDKTRLAPVRSNKK